MKLFPPVIPSACSFAVLVLAGCGSTPTAVKDLAQQTRSVTSRMGEVHQQDLRTLATYDRLRVVQFNHLLSDYVLLRSRVVDAFNDAFDKSKQAAIADLDAKFDREADRLLTNFFWANFRKEADGGLNQNLLAARERAVAKDAASAAFPGDTEAASQAFVALRQRYLAAAIAYETVEASFAELALKISQKRSEFHADNVKLFASVSPLAAAELSAAQKSFTLPDSTAAIDARITELRGAYGKLDDAEGKLMEYLNDKSAAENFLKAVLIATAGVQTAPDSAAKSPVPTTPADPAAATATDAAAKPADLGDIVSAFAAKLKSVESTKADGEKGLSSVISTLLEQAKNITHVAGSSAADVATATAKPSP